MAYRSYSVMSESVRAQAAEIRTRLPEVLKMMLVYLQEPNLKAS